MTTGDLSWVVKACDARLGVPEACDQERWDSASPSERERLKERATLLRFEGCDAGSWEDCALFSKTLSGQDRVRIEKRYIALALASCFDGDREACDSLHRESELDIVDELRVNERACALDLRTCRVLAALHLAGRGGKAPHRARRAYEMSCLAAPPGGSYDWKRDDCVAALKLYRELGGDPTRARAVAKQACTLGEASACEPATRKP